MRTVASERRMQYSATIVYISNECFHISYGRTSTVHSHAIDLRVCASLVEAASTLLAGSCGDDHQANVHVEER